MSYRTSTRRTASRTTGPRANKYAGDCRLCGLAVEAGRGLLEGGQASGWTVRHVPAAWSGSPVSGSYAGGCPGEADRHNLAGQWGRFAEPRCADSSHASQVTATGGCDSCGREVITPRPAAQVAPVQAGEGDDLREVSRRAGSKYAYTASGARMTMGSRRCEDAPCCGCCD